jgi:hypothetical protein
VTAVSFKVDYSDISALTKALAHLTGRIDMIAAISISKSSKAAADKLRTNILPQIKGGATAWTSRQLRHYPATPVNLSSAVGWSSGAGNLWQNWSGTTRLANGVPSGRYMGLLSRGGDRGPKGTEIRLRKAGLIKADQFIVPNRFAGSLINKHGNLPGGEYKRILSRLGAGNTLGSTQNTGKGKGSKRAAADYFVLRSSGSRPSRWQLGATPSAIAQRAGAGPKGGTGKGTGQQGRPQTVGYRRGFIRSLSITKQPNYEKKFNIKSIAMSEFRRVFKIQFEQVTKETVEYRRSRGLM